MKNYQLVIPYSMEADEVIGALDCDVVRGLSVAEAARRLKEFGPNKLTPKKNKSIWLLLLSQFKSPIVLLLIFAAGLSLYFGEIPDAIAILVVIFINAGIGFYMEYQAERSMDALKRLSAVPAKVFRDKQLAEINAEEVVPGDVIYIEAGDVIPADGRIFTAAQVQVDESSLTGASIPVEK